MGDPILGQRVREVRTSLGTARGHKVPQTEFAELLGLETGQAVSNLERGVSEVTLERATRLAALSGKPAAYFLDAGFDPEASTVDATELRQLVEAVATLQESVEDVLRLLRAEPPTANEAGSAGN